MVNHRKKKKQNCAQKSQKQSNQTQRVQIRLEESKSDRKESHISSEISSTQVPPGPSRNLAAVKDGL